MADEITLNIRLDYSNAGVTDSLAAAVSKSIDVVDSYLFHGTSKIQVSAAALELGEQGTLGYFIGVNRSTTGTIILASGATDGEFCELGPGESACFKFKASVTAPYASADIADTVLEYMIVSA